MKSNRAAQSSVDISNLSVPDAEEIIEEALSELAFSQDPGLARALRFLAPPGYQAIVELCSENGRSKRRNAPADSWSPEDDEVRIYFERLDDNAAPARQSRGSRAPIEHNFEEDEEESAVVPADLDARVKELCAALAEAERGGHAFIALSGSETHSYREKRSAGTSIRNQDRLCWPRQFRRGVVLTSKIANPKTPAYPTTTIRLNRAEAGIPDEAQRFHPLVDTGRIHR